MRSENEIKMQLYGSIDWMNNREDKSSIIQGTAEVKTLKWVLGEIEKIDSSIYFIGD